MTLFDQCVEAVEAAQARHYDHPNAEHITRAVLETIRDHTPSPRTTDEMCRVLGEEGGGMDCELVRLDNMLAAVGPEARDAIRAARISDFGNTASDRMLERLPVRIGPNCEPVVGGGRV